MHHPGSSSGGAGVAVGTGRFLYHRPQVNLPPVARVAEGAKAMVGLLLRAAITALSLWVASQLLPGLQFSSGAKLAIAAVLLGLVNAVVRPIAFVLTLPITVVTLGLFLLVLNAAMIGLVAWIVPGFTISGFWTAVGGAIIVSLVSWAASSVIGNSGRVERFNHR
jgi:putative membrane protein